MPDAKPDLLKLCFWNCGPQTISGLPACAKQSDTCTGSFLSYSTEDKGGCSTEN